MKFNACNNFLDVLFAAIFLALVCAPNLHFSKEEISKNENRALAKFVPPLKKIDGGGGYLNLNFGRDFENFYNDRFFLRKEFLALNSFFKKIFSSQCTSNKNVLCGKEDFLFYRGDESEINFLNYKLFEQAELERGLKYLCDINAWCKKNGKTFVFLICPDKNKIYGEYFPAAYKKVRPDTESRANQFANFVKKNSDVAIIYPCEKLLLEKSSEKILYYKNDTHWNFLGAFFAYQELLKELKNHLEIEEVFAQGFEEERLLRGDLNTLALPEIQTQDEKTIYKKPKINSSYETLSKGIPHTTLLKTRCNGKTYNAVFFRDSFCQALLAFTSNTFCEATYYWRYDITKKDLQYIKQNADVVILECVERLLPHAVLRDFPKEK